MKRLTESLDHNDMEDQLKPILSIDEYSAKMGSDSDVVTLSFIVNSSLAAEDLVGWFEKGYDFVLDASVSEGEIEPGKYVLFVEIERRVKVPQRIMLLLRDLETLTGLSIDEWQLKIDDEEYPADEDIIRDTIILNPNVYRAEKENEDELNEMRTQAGIDTKKIYTTNSKEVKDFVSLAGL